MLLVSGLRRLGSCERPTPQPRKRSSPRWILIPCFWLPRSCFFHMRDRRRLTPQPQARVQELGVSWRSGANFLDVSLPASTYAFPLCTLCQGTIKESCIDPEADDIVASSAKSPVVYAIMSAHEFRWLVTQVTYPYLGKLCSLVIPCALTTLDHWSPEVKGPGMVTFIHLAKNVNSAELGWYGEPILDICSRNIASSDELWEHVVEMSVLLLTCIERGNPRSPWCEQILSEMLGHLERQPEIKKWRVAWLLRIEPVLNFMGLLLLAHFRRIFLLLFQWLHAEDDETIILVLERVHTIVKVTWVRKSPFILRLIDELTLVYKEAAMKKEREAIRSRIGQIIVLLQKCHGTQLEAAWEKHKGDPDLAALTSLHCSSSGVLPR